MTRPVYAPMPRHAARYLDTQAAPASLPAKPAFQARYIARVSRIEAALPRVVDTLFICLAVLVLVAFHFAELLGRWVDKLDWRGADRALTFAFLVVAAFYLSFILMAAWSGGAFDRLVR